MLLNLDNQQFQSLYFEDADKALMTKSDALFIIEDKAIYNVIDAERHEIKSISNIKTDALFTYQE
ncbi:hypothetical protein S4054249_07315 [Pseudoalteromonas luteoviolacea]|uniref:Uncharacterized protein n=1 Tax=Pseudoalteromonas luteoviolacea S4054 TaxID=1129367 RepID=A0A0F6A526_9GAMM|nr:hypothetical protein S4054249_07315 [Pseudoalteromonas luteoviolacea]AOT12579.1 hypothetical protein S40542_07315 [Pseudoalteromonas luteoviolacea]AOT17493.1 hypothetical protein S4054_07315 [Pseudoalteromonas luteoviolacea]KKE81198.1 hypothetical protein N479_23235 [Pseudoalteromonas luteoviolacea S4054]KZN66326.1 hypothetical protein N481_24330 [Pseudoalteromonas luteoviolacea S4047-1]